MLMGGLLNSPGAMARDFERGNYQIKEQIISGKVTDETGLPLHGVTVTLKTNKGAVITGAMTAADGTYKITASDEGGLLSFSMVGYESKTIAIDKASVIDVALNPASGSLNEVVVVGYGTQKKVTLTGAVTSLKGGEVVKNPNINIANSLAGQLPGVIINNRSGEPGRDEPNILIRGRSTTGNSAPLVIIDGVERSGLGQLNPNDIENISVLKDASAAIYGARAANGVILVTTRRGSAKRKPTVDFSYNQGFTTASRNPIMADSYTFFNVFNEIEQGEGRPARYSQEELMKFKAGSEPGYANFDWYDFIVKDQTPQHRSDLSVSGGTDRTQYYLSFGEVGQSGQYRFGSTSLKRYNIRSNVDVQVTENLKMGMNLAARFDDSHHPYQSANELNSHIFLYQPNWVPYWPGTENLTPNRDNDNIINWVGDASGYRTSRTNILQTSLFGTLKIPQVKGLSVYGSVNYDPTSSFSKAWQLPTYVYYKDAATGEYMRGRSGRGANNPALTDQAEFASRLYLTSRMNYDRQFGEHQLSAMAGYEQQTNGGNYVAASRSDYVSTALPQIFAGSTDKTKQANNGSESLSTRKNYFVRVSYNYREKYLAEFTFRRDGSPNFAADHRWGNFPGGSVGYVISEENFLKNNPVIGFLKLRASYGLMGNDLINSFQYLQTYSYGNNYVIGNNDVNGLVQSGTPNPNITWETAKTTNLGLDADLWNGKLGINLDLFKTRRSDILTRRSAVIPGYTGLALPDENIGIVDNKGIELVLSHASRASKLRYNLSGNFAFVRNEVIFSDEQPAAEPYQYATGRPMGAGLYYKAIGVFKDQADIDSYPHFINARPGDLKYEDMNGDGQLNSLDRIRVNQTSTPEITYGLTASFQYEGFDLSFLLQGQANAKAYFGDYFPVMSYSLGNFLNWRADDRWTPENTDATQPRASYEVFNNNTAGSTQWLFNAAFLKLRNLQLGYTLPESLVNKAGMKKLRLYVSGSNLLILADHMKALGFDPETTDYWYYPPQRVVNFGVSVTF